VDDEATAMLMTEFHRQIARGVPKAQALQCARAYVEAQERHRHPYFWSAFVLSGDPGANPGR
jgi:CHAT domain-containing protein